MSLEIDEDGTVLLPFRPGDWVAEKKSHSRLAKVKSVYLDRTEVLFDLVLYDLQGRRIGRESPVEGGPRTFEPCCSTTGWERITEPDFPVRLQWVPEGDHTRARYVAGDVLPPARYRKRNTKKTSSLGGKYSKEKEAFRKALEKIADGHNDPRDLASSVLGRR